MAQVGRAGAEGVYNIGSAPNARRNMFDLSSPAGWTMVFWMLSILIIGAIFLSL